MKIRHSFSHSTGYDGEIAVTHCGIDDYRENVSISFDSSLDEITCRECLVSERETLQRHVKKIELLDKKISELDFDIEYDKMIEYEET